MPQALSATLPLCSPAGRLSGKFRSFLERHPSLVPGARTPGSPSGHFPLHCALITQPRLPGFHSRVPDFMWIAVDSGTWYPTLIEIESPDKKLFTRDGQQTAKFSQAKNQLDRWHSWFCNPTNVQQFIELYGIPSSWCNLLNRQLHMILIYGRRAEFVRPAFNFIDKLLMDLGKRADREV